MPNLYRRGCGSSEMVFISFVNGDVFMLPYNFMFMTEKEEIKYKVKRGKVAIDLMWRYSQKLARTLAHKDT